LHPAIAAISKREVRDTLTRDFSDRFHTTQFPPILAIIGQLVTPEDARFFCACWEYFSPVTGGTNVARKSQSRESKFSKSIPKLERLCRLEVTASAKVIGEILPSAGLPRGESGALL
jgi:hypothetical protein